MAMSEEFLHAMNSLFYGADYKNSPDYQRVQSAIAKITRIEPTPPCGNCGSERMVEKQPDGSYKCRPCIMKEKSECDRKGEECLYCKEVNESDISHTSNGRVLVFCNKLSKEIVAIDNT